MKIIGLDGKSYPFPLKEADIVDESRSSGHKKALDFAHTFFPFDKIFQEVSLPGSGGLTADILIMLRRVIFEINGKQHYQHIPYFHRTLADFQKAKQRDLDKIRWANLNGFYLVELDDRDHSDWEIRVKEFFNYGKQNSAESSE